MTFAELREVRMNDGRAFISYFKDYLREKNYQIPFIKKNTNWGLKGTTRFDSKYEIVCFDLYFLYVMDVDSKLPLEKKDTFLLL